MADSSSSSAPASGSLSPYCACNNFDTPPLPLQVAPHPYDNTAFLLSLSPNQQLIPTVSLGGSCTKKPGFTGRTSLRYHIFSDGVYQNQLREAIDDPDGDHTRTNLRQL